MTIKQNGGVFGRNPSFNDVEANDLIAGNVEIPQGGKLYIGNGSPGGSPRGDLEIYHNGSNSYIDEVFTGNLLIRGHSRIQFQGYVSGKNFIIMDDGGAVSLWHNGANKLQTTSTGIGVTGNVALTDGGGIDFSATSGTGTSELFDDYEEGTWTPTVAGGSITITNATYTKVGRLVTVSGRIVCDTATSGDFGGLPFSATPTATFSGSVGYQNVDSTTRAVFCDGGTTFSFRVGSGPKHFASAGQNARFTLTYETAS